MHCLRAHAAPQIPIAQGKESLWESAVGERRGAVRCAVLVGEQINEMPWIQVHFATSRSA